MLRLNGEEIVECQTSLLQFTKTMFRGTKNEEFIENWHHVSICAALEKVFVGKTRRLIINIPPRYSKTEICINFIAWSMGIFPDSEFIMTSYSKRLAAKNSMGVRSLLESDVYGQIFPHAKVRADSRAKDEWRTTEGGTVYSAGSGGSLTGFGGGKGRADFGGAIIVDDPHKSAEAVSGQLRQRVLDWFDNTVKSRVNSPHTPIILVMQRLHELDLSGYLLNQNKGDLRAAEWEHLCIPVLDDSGCPLWEHMHPLEAIKSLEEANPYVFSGQYMQRPSPLGGGLFKDEWWQYYDELPPLEYLEIFADTAQKTKERNDFSVFMCAGVYEGKLYIVDICRGKWEAPELRRRARQFWVKHLGSGKQVTGRLRCMNVEDKSSGTGLIQDLSHDKSLPIPVFPIKRNIDKYTRAMNGQPYIECGKVFLPRESPWLHDFLVECSKFTSGMTHAHDDQVDTLLDAIDVLLSSSGKVSGAW